MDTRKLDLNLLVTLDMLMTQRSVTRAAVELGMSQPAVSASLQRLRGILGDPLFVRTRDGMAPTAYALALHGNIKQGLDALRKGLDGALAFEAASAEREFRLLLSDVGQVLYLPALMQRVRAAAPHVTLTAVALPRDRYRDALENGEVDLAVGHLPQLGDVFFKQLLLEDRFVCIASRWHPRIKKSLSLQRFAAESHVAIAPSGVAPNLLEQTLHRLKIRRHVALTIPNFLAAPLIVRGTELLACVPQRVLRAMPTLDDVVQLAFPFESPVFPVNQFWHRRQHHDQGNRWLRALIAEAMSSPCAGDYVAVPAKGAGKAS